MVNQWVKLKGFLNNFSGLVLEHQLIVRVMKAVLPEDQSHPRIHIELKMFEITGVPI